MGGCCEEDEGFSFHTCVLGHLWSPLFLCSSPVCVTVCCAIFSSYLSCSYRHIPVIYLFCSFLIPHFSSFSHTHFHSHHIHTLSASRLSISLTRPLHLYRITYLPTRIDLYYHSLSLSHFISLCGYISHPTRTQGQNPIIHIISWIPLFPRLL